MTRKEIYAAVLEAMQPAEELNGPEGDEYLKLMADIASEATKRITTQLERGYAPKVTIFFHDPLCGMSTCFGPPACNCACHEAKP